MSKKITFRFTFLLIVPNYIQSVAPNPIRVNCPFLISIKGILSKRCSNKEMIEKQNNSTITSF